MAMDILMTEGRLLSVFSAAIISEIFF